MSSYSNTLRAWAEALLCGETGSTRTLTAGRFHRATPAGDLESHPTDSAERAIDIVLGGPRYPDGLNGIDGFVLAEHTLTVRVSYALTNAGDDGTEATSEQDGSGTLNAIQDRAASDEFDIAMTLQWHANQAGVDPAILNMVPGESTTTTEAQRVVLNIPFTISVWATVPGRSSAVEGYAT